MWMRILLAILLLATVQIAVWVIDNRLRPDEIQALAAPLGGLPRQLGRWTGVDAELDPRLMEATYSTDIVNREYTSTEGVKIKVQIASFDRYESGVPHLPEGCYTANGCVVIGRDTIKLRTGPDSSEPAFLISFDRDGKQLTLLYWFRLGDHQIADNVDLHAAKKTFFGEKKWPSIVKVMLQSDTGPTNQTRDALRELGELVLAQTRSLGAADGKPPAEPAPTADAKPNPKIESAKPNPSAKTPAAK